MSISNLDVRDCGCKKIFNYTVSESMMKELNKLSLVFASVKSSPFIVSGKLFELSDDSNLKELLRFRDMLGYNDNSIVVRKNFSKTYTSFIKKCGKAIELSREEFDLFMRLSSLCPLLMVQLNNDEDIFNGINNMSLELLSNDIVCLIEQFMTVLNLLIRWRLGVEINIDKQDLYFTHVVCDDNKNFIDFVLSDVLS